MTEISLYTDQMRRAFRSVAAPKNFGVAIAEHTDNGVLLFLEIIADEQDFMSLNYEDKIEAVRYLFKVKHALEDNGAVVQITRKAID
jgi:hypothetical protein